jgi:hypothetical protein
VAWTVEKGLIAEPLGYAEIVDVSFRP